MSRVDHRNDNELLHYGNMHADLCIHKGAGSDMLYALSGTRRMS
jgi:hypothetical protein